MIFSGLKTYTRNTWLKAVKESDATEQTKADICRAFEIAVAETLTIKCKRALEQENLNTIVIAGGVSANRAIREKLSGLMRKRRGEIFYPRLQFCTDNGAMIAYAGAQRLLAGQQDSLSFAATPRWSLEELVSL